MANLDLAPGTVWRLWHGEVEVARLSVVEADFPWLRATIEELPAFEPFRGLFQAQEKALDDEDWDHYDELCSAVGEKLRMTYPDGRTVPEFMLNVHGDGTCGWRWSDEPFEEDASEADHDLVMATARSIIATDAAIIHRLGTV